MKSGRPAVSGWYRNGQYEGYPTQADAPYRPERILADGYKIVNSGFFPTYEYPAGPPAKPSVEWMYENWSVNVFHGPALLDSVGNGTSFYTVDAAAAAGQLGSALNVWNSGGAWNQDEAAEAIHPKLRVMAQKTWNSAPLVTSYSEFEPIIAGVGSAPE